MSRLIPILALLLSCSLLHAQHNNRSARDLQFNFGNPGARSLGFGGAFLALADDATAPVANPAGLTRTAFRAASLELRYTRLDNEIPFAAGDIVQTNLFEFDFRLESQKASENILNLPYGAVLFPVGDWRFAVFAHQQADLKRAYSTEGIDICQLSDPDWPDCASNPVTAFGPGDDILDMQMLNTGFSVARSFNDVISFGFSVFSSSLDYQADSILNVTRPTRVVTVERLARSSDDDWGAILGMLWDVTSDFSVGITYKSQPDFTYTAELRKSGPLTNTPDDFIEEGALFDIPDSLSFGISIKPTEVTTLNVDVNRVYYSQVTENLVDFTDTGAVDDNIFQAMADVTEIHVGFEWIFAEMSVPLSVRVGYWLDPYHAALNSVADNQLLGGRVGDTFVRDIFFLNEFAEDTNHYAFGLGWTFGTAFQLDVGVDISNKDEVGSMSGIYRF